ncbi:hypothetical protein DMENIID0001_146660 [Sergentomyia squamirostris]
MSEELNYDDSGSEQMQRNVPEGYNSYLEEEDSSHIDGNSLEFSTQGEILTDEIDSSSTSTPREATKDVPLSFELIPGRRRRYQRRPATVYNNDGSYKSSICESVKLRQRRKSVYLEEDYVMSTKNIKEKLPQKKEPRFRKEIVKERRKSVSNVVTQDDDAPRPAKINRRRQTMVPTRDVTEEESQDTLHEFPKSNRSSHDSVSNLEFSLNELSEKNTMTPPPPASSLASTSSSSRRKSTLKPMDTEIKFEKIVSYRNPTIPYTAEYRACISLLNKISHPPVNEQLMRRLATLKVCRQYFYNEFYGRKSRNSSRSVPKSFSGNNN